LALLKVRGPFAVRNFIVPVVVYAFKSHSFETLAHIVKEGAKTVSPSKANSNPTASIIFPAWIILICATLDHVDPSLVSWSAGLPMCGHGKNVPHVNLACQAQSA
jgi:hypothetical protein